MFYVVFLLLFRRGSKLSFETVLGLHDIIDKHSYELYKAQFALSVFSMQNVYNTAG